MGALATEEITNTDTQHPHTHTHNTDTNTLNQEEEHHKHNLEENIHKKITDISLFLIELLAPEEEVNDKKISMMRKINDIFNLQLDTDAHTQTPKEQDNTKPNTTDSTHNKVTHNTPNKDTHT